MKTLLKLLSLLLAVGLPGAFAAEFVGLPLPAAVDSLHLFTAFLVSVFFLLALSDYAERRPLRLPRTAAPAAVRPEAKAAHALAA